MEAPPHVSAGKDLINRYPAALLVVPTLCLLLGQIVYPLAYPLIAFACLALLVTSGFLLRLSLMRWALLLLLSASTLLLGYSMHRRLLHPDLPEQHIVRLKSDKQPDLVDGILYREPERLPGRSRWYLRVERVWQPLGAQETLGDVLVTVRNARKEWFRGDHIRCRLRLREPRPAANPGEFDYRAYLARRGIYLTGYLDNDNSVELLGHGPSGPRAWFEGMRGKIRRSIDGRLSGREGAVLKALVIGDREGLSGGDRERFAASGVAHLLSISGLHVGMLGLAAFLLARFLGSFSTTVMLRWNLLKAATIFSFLVVLFYTGLSGGRIPTIRAAMMVAVYGVAVLLDREQEFYSSLAIAALIIGLLWPGVVFDISFQLSFLAVLFIVWGLQRIQELKPETKKDPLEPEPGWLRRWMPRLGLYLVVPVLATVGTGPIVAYHFGRLSLAGFLANPLLVPLVGFLLVPLGFLIGFLSLIAAPLALPLLWLAKPLLFFTLLLVDFFAALPMGNFAVPPPGVIEIVLIYLFICALLVVRKRRQLYLLLACVLAGVMIDEAYWLGERWLRSDLRITYLSVGHGDAAVVELPGPRVLLIDAGGNAFGRFDPGKSIVVPFLRSRGIVKLDYAVVAHPRVDHYGGMASVFDEFHPTEFWSAPEGGDWVRFERLDAIATRLGLRRVIMSQNDSCRTIENVELCVLYPPATAAAGSSLVLRLSFGRFHFLFPGDIQRGDEEKLVASGTTVGSQVLKVPRHGSRTASGSPFVASVRPKLAIFSVGTGNAFGFPRSEVVDRYRDTGSQILRTDQDGAVTVETDGERMFYHTFLSGKTGEIAPE